MSNHIINRNLQPCRFSAAAGDEHRYLELLERRGWLALTTCHVNGEGGAP